MSRAPLFAAFVASLVLALPAQAQDVTGVWDFTFTTPQGSQSSVYTLKQEGKAVTGVADLAQMGKLEIKEGMMTADTLSFVVEISNGSTTFPLEIWGVVSGALIEGAAYLQQMGDIPFKGKRRDG